MNIDSSKNGLAALLPSSKVAAKTKLATKSKQERNERKEQWINVIMIQHV